MSLVMDTLRASPVTEDLSDSELKVLSELFGVRSGY